MFHSRAAVISTLVLADGAALTLLCPDPGRLAYDVSAPRAWVAHAGPDRALATLGAVGLWLAAAWIGLGLLAAVSAQLPGTLGRASARICAAVLPRVLRRLIAGSAGLGVLLVPVVAGAQQAPAPPASSISATALPAPVWPVTPQDASPPASSLPAPLWPAGPSSAPAPARPRPSSLTPSVQPRSTPPTPAQPTTQPSSTQPRRTHAPHPAAPARVTPAPSTRRPTGAAVRVHAGDSLWLLAARRLGPSATDAQIAADWPRWYAANRVVIGDDSGLITPGQVLQVPAPTAREPR